MHLQSLDLRRIATLRPLFAIPFGLQLYLLMGRLIPSTKPFRRGLTSSMKAVARGETEPSVGIRLLLPPSCLELPGVVAEPPLALDVYAPYIGGLRACSDPMRLAYLAHYLHWPCACGLRPVGCSH